MSLKVVFQFQSFLVLTVYTRSCIHIVWSCFMVSRFDFFQSWKSCLFPERAASESLLDLIVSARFLTLLTELWYWFLDQLNTLWSSQLTGLPALIQTELFLYGSTCSFHPGIFLSIISHWVLFCGRVSGIHFCPDHLTFTSSYTWRSPNGNIISVSIIQDCCYWADKSED